QPLGAEELLLDLEQHAARLRGGQHRGGAELLDGCAEVLVRGPARADHPGEQVDRLGGDLAVEQATDEARLGVAGPCRVRQRPPERAGGREGVGHLEELGAELTPALARLAEGDLPPLARRTQCGLAARSHHASVAPPTFSPPGTSSVWESSSSRKRSMTR